ncbi:uncharacterized protein N7483_011498 [Penicillium malachiteum]|uniref:uncharacterized protein n=1 Tax=Penicillium malachiteum TaxID=1324776 RepID=UPI00254677B1|nr:uncharacterized protein N7483_011498 [Penicillium malachiteum]KAJ5714317.1 hypothetical protein N7483_011498 [Penicillium malachiteum]
MESEKRKIDDHKDNPGPLKKRVLGPSLPPAAQPSDSKTSSAEDSDSDSDDDFGPSLPPPNGVAVKNEQPLQPSTNSTVPKSEQAETQRDQWMLNPPEQSDWANKIDPTQLRNRKFQTGKSARTTTSKNVDSSWTETPEERMRRIGDQVMGIGNPSNNSNPPSQSRSSQAQAQAQSMGEKIKKFNDRTGKASRLEKPQAEREEAEDDPSARAFDREKDMGLASKISSSQRRDMVNRASGYSSRFTKGDFL